MVTLWSCNTNAA